MRRVKYISRFPHKKGFTVDKIYDVLKVTKDNYLFNIVHLKNDNNLEISVLIVKENDLEFKDVSVELRNKAIDYILE